MQILWKVFGRVAIRFCNKSIKLIFQVLSHRGRQIRKTSLKFEQERAARLWTCLTCLVGEWRPRGWLSNASD